MPEQLQSCYYLIISQHFNTLLVCVCFFYYKIFNSYRIYIHFQTYQLISTVIGKAANKSVVLSRTAVAVLLFTVVRYWIWIWYDFDMHVFQYIQIKSEFYRSARARTRAIHSAFSVFSLFRFIHTKHELREVKKKHKTQHMYTIVWKLCASSLDIYIYDSQSQFFGRNGTEKWACEKHTHTQKLQQWNKNKNMRYFIINPGEIISGMFFPPSVCFSFSLCSLAWFRWCDVTPSAHFCYGIIFITLCACNVIH